jgi:hypothetical protein
MQLPCISFACNTITMASNVENQAKITFLVFNGSFGVTC